MQLFCSFFSRNLLAIVWGGGRLIKAWKKIGERVCCELGWLDIYNLCNPPTPPTYHSSLFLSHPSIPCDIHSSAKCVWQALRLWAPSQWPLTLVCPDTRDEYLQDTEGKQAAMSGLYCVLPRLGTVSIIKQMTPEGCAPRGGRSRRRQSSGQKHLGRIFLSPLLFSSPSLPMILPQEKERRRGEITVRHCTKMSPVWDGQSSGTAVLQRYFETVVSYL